MISKSTNLAMGEAALAVLNTLNDLDLTACVVTVSETYPGLEVDVQIDNQDVAAVDTIAVHLGLAPDDDERSENYTRTGDVTVYGLPLSLTVFCGRPAPVRVASVDLSKAATA